MISVTFDDGFKNNFIEAVPILKKHGARATFYVSSGFIDKPGFMSKNDLLEIQSLGNEVASHGDTHPNLVFSFNKRRREEIFESKKKLESFGLEIKTFAYPYGWHNKKIRELVKSAGYKNARAFKPYRNFNTKDNDIFALSTYAITKDSQLEHIKNIIENRPDNTWIILTFHGIKEKPGFWDTTPDFLEEIILFIKTRNEKVLTISEGFDMMYNNKTASANT